MSELRAMLDDEVSTISGAIERMIATVKPLESTHGLMTEIDWLSSMLTGFKLHLRDIERAVKRAADELEAMGE